MIRIIVLWIKHHRIINYNVLRADAVASGCSEADGSSYAYDVLMSLL